MRAEAISYYITHHPLLVTVSITICLLCIARHPGLCRSQITKAYPAFFRRVRALEDMCEAKAMEIGIVDILREEIRHERNCVSVRPGKEISRWARSVTC
ncbi:unnamed protein product [Tuber melanosporum]|uniref:(Perigord truffle) hypothetical protein n=1 Tax=Tuber melanosporum (strain Mel28) TaxID=656061 RepID=D5GDJ9_TUBMM|nr:uncharacterized protein GSTUM_00001054001 [Tuber melanosporum]CAZ82592.1 unnamed protein product [Tuber melanosporum]